MAKKTKKDKEIARLRREVEALKAQVQSAPRKQENIKTPKHPDVPSGATRQAKKQRDEGTAVETIPVSGVRSDLRKTAVLTAVCLAILLALFLTQPHWSGILN